MAQKKKKVTFVTKKVYPDRTETLALKNGELRSGANAAYGRAYSRRKGIADGTIQAVPYVPKSERRKNKAKKIHKPQPNSYVTKLKRRSYLPKPMRDINDPTLTDEEKDDIDPLWDILHRPMMAVSHREPVHVATIAEIFGLPAKTTIEQLDPTAPLPEPPPASTSGFTFSPQPSDDNYLNEMIDELQSVEKGTWIQEPPPKRREYVDQKLWKYATDQAKEARKTLLDYMRCNTFEWWLGFSFKPEYTDDERQKAIQKWIKSLQKQAEIICVYVPERQKSRGGLHYHMVLAGATEKQLSLEYNGRHGVFHMTDWDKYGLSYAKKITPGTQVNIGFYMSKHFNAYYDNFGNFVLNHGKRLVPRGKVKKPNEKDGTLVKAQLICSTDDPEINIRTTPRKKLKEMLDIDDIGAFDMKKNDKKTQFAFLKAEPINLAKFAIARAAKELEAKEEAEKKAEEKAMAKAEREEKRAEKERKAEEKARKAEEQANTTNKPKQP